MGTAAVSAENVGQHSTAALTATLSTKKLGWKWIL